MATKKKTVARKPAVTLRRKKAAPAPTAKGPAGVPPLLARDVGLLETLLRSLLGAVPPAPVPPEKDPAWMKACDEVVAAFASAQMRENMKDPPRVETIRKHVQRDLPRAVEIFGLHPTDTPPCECRHYSIVAAGAERAVRAQDIPGTDFEAAVKNGMHIVDTYLASRS